MDLAEKVALYAAVCSQIKKLEEEKEKLREEILAEMPVKKMDFPIGTVQRYTRLLIKMPIENARQFAATQMVEQIDKNKIKHLFYSGTPLEGVKEFSYLVVKMH